jgi:hypothetical protein
VTSERWQRVKLLFERALDQAPVACDAFLEESGESPSIVAEVRRLIAVDAQAGNFLEDAGAGSSGPAISIDLGTHLGPYRIDTVIGKGGMGVVYRAVDTRLNRTVAVKIAIRRPGGSGFAPPLPA